MSKDISLISRKFDCMSKCLISSPITYQPEYQNLVAKSLFSICFLTTLVSGPCDSLLFKSFTLPDKPHLLLHSEKKFSKFKEVVSEES
jgi:hypothetical protein